MGGNILAKEHRRANVQVGRVSNCDADPIVIETAACVRLLTFLAKANSKLL
jgi:hypothetical protein